VRRYLIFFLALILIGIMFYWSAERRREAAQKTHDSGTLDKKTATKPTPKVAKQSVTPPKKPTPIAKFSPTAGLPGQPTVDFKVVDGLAVAYGDVILGKTEDPEIKQGMAYVTPPELWDPPEIPYAISSDLTRPERVQKAVDYFNTHTGVTFVPFDNQPDALIFQKGPQFCLSTLGKSGGMQPIKLADSCEWPQVVHEMMHSLGFIHEQSRPDRDSYIEILWPNINDDQQTQFAMVPESLAIAERNSSFDYQSIMLYPPTLFAKSAGSLTMHSRTAQPIAPVTEGLSNGDLQKLNQLYPK
jgi:hypothetical protein